MDIYDDIFKDDVDTSLPDFEDLSADEILRRTRLLDNTIRLLKDESTRLSLEQSGLKEKVWEQCMQSHFFIVLLSSWHTRRVMLAESGGFAQGAKGCLIG